MADYVAFEAGVWSGLCWLIIMGIRFAARKLKVELGPWAIKITNLVLSFGGQVIFARFGLGKSWQESIYLGGLSLFASAGIHDYFKKTTAEKENGQAPTV